MPKRPLLLPTMRATTARAFAGETGVALGVAGAGDAAVLCALRRAGVESINVDMMYGLPGQTLDHVVDPSSLEIIRSNVSSRDFTERMLSESYHVATLDNDQDLIAQKTVAFIRSIAGR